ncbi:PHP domain-containing protein [Pontibacillus salicampi]|uniref:PHP domain-containing protein n=1 Tax=Pontibacillus salicampi TaxID=1449801 RepID=A0ABV6LS34_9BACI
MIDLHCHTSTSDNTMSISEVIYHAKENGITHLAITDHDTTAGLAEAEQIGIEAGVTIIAGIEISAYDYKRDKRAHILGYHVSADNEELYHLCNPMVKKRHFASYEMVQKIAKAGYDVSWEEVQAYAKHSTSVYKQHIMHALMDKGYTDRIYGPLYKTLFAKGTAETEEGLAYTPIDYLDAIDAIRTINDIGGIAVLAHPAQFDNYEAVEEWTKHGLKGIEVYHPDHDEGLEAKTKQYAKTYGLIQTGGSDFHGGYGPSERFPLGSKNPGLQAVEALSKHMSFPAK